MLWIISVSSTVLPTPAPPNSPALPPVSSGTSTSIILMPVSKMAEVVERWTSGGGSRCTERHVTSFGSSWRSMAWPKTSNIRDRMALPTGASSGPPVSDTDTPRARPCVGVSAMPRTWRVSICVSTSIAIWPSVPARSKVRMGGKRPLKRASTTLPRTAVITPALGTSDSCATLISQHANRLPGQAARAQSAAALALGLSSEISRCEAPAGRFGPVWADADARSVSFRTDPARRRDYEDRFGSKAPASG